MITWFDVLYSFGMGLFAGTAAIIATIAIEKLGGILGGVIGSAPMTTIASAAGVAYVTQSPEAVSDVMFTFPTGMLINVLVLLIWRQAPSVVPRHWSLSLKLSSVLCVSLLAWLVLVAAVVLGVNQFMREYISVMIIGSVAAGLMLVVGLLTVFLQPLPAPRGVNSVTLGMHLARGLLAGGANFVAGLIVKTNPIAAGFAASFPAIFLTTMMRYVAHPCIHLD